MKHTLLILLCLLSLALPLSAQAPAGPIGIEGLEAGLTTAIPFGDFADVAGFGIGAQARLPIHVKTVPGLVLRPQAGLLFYSSPLSTVAGIMTLKLDAAAGWIFPVTDAITVTPTLAYGALFHLALLDSPSFFMDSGFTLAVEGTYALNDDIDIYLEPGYQFFLEEGTAGHQLVINAGVALALGGGR